jgi:hypothetical protein
MKREDRGGNGIFILAQAFAPEKDPLNRNQSPWRRIALMATCQRAHGELFDMG